MGQQLSTRGRRLGAAGPKRRPLLWGCGPSPLPSSRVMALQQQRGAIEWCGRPLRSRPGVRAGLPRTQTGPAAAQSRFDWPPLTRCDAN